MPEGLETQMSPKELADLFAYITLDKPPGDPAARPIPGTPPESGSEVPSGQRHRRPP